MKIVRIAIDARKLHDFGIGTYVQNLLRHLARLDAESEYVLFCKADDRESLSGLGPNFRAVVESAEPYSVMEQINIPHAPRARADHSVP